MSDITKNSRLDSRGWNAILHNADLIVTDCPVQILEPLLSLDGATMNNAKEDEKIPKYMFGFGLVSGLPSPYITGPGSNWPTELGQAVIDMLKGRISRNWPYAQTGGKQP